MMLITNSGTLIRTAVDGISVLGRNTQGVKLIRTSDEEKLVQVVRVVNEDDDESVEEAEQGASDPRSAENGSAENGTAENSASDDNDSDDSSADNTEDNPTDN